MARKVSAGCPKACARQFEATMNEQEIVLTVTASTNALQNIIVTGSQYTSYAAWRLGELARKTI
jgi:hypothetical protein